MLCIESMYDPDKFIELVGHICRRPQMFTLGGTFGEVVAYFTGLASSPNASPLSDDDDRAFNFFVTARLVVPSKYSWPGAIKMVAADEADALARLRDLVTEFATLRKTRSFKEIATEAAKSLAEYEETEPARVWRRFLHLARWRAFRRQYAW